MVSNKIVFSNVIWRFFERFSAQGVSFFVSIILARLLEPEAYGTIALISVFTTIFNVFIDSGLGNALIQKKDADDLDFSSVFYFNVIVCCILYIVLFVAAPFLAAFYENVQLTNVIRIVGLTLIISGVKNIQQAYVSRNMQFKRFFFATLGGTIGSAIIGIVMAYHGFGVWALVVQNLFNTLVDTVILWATVRWRPKLMFSLQRLQVLLSYGWKFLASSLIDTIYRKLRQIIIGKYYSSSDLAFYNKGDHFPNLIVSNINISIDSVLLPTMSAEQDNRERVKLMTRRAIKISCYVMCPMMFGLAAVATPLVRVLLTEKWLPTVFYLRIFCFVYCFQPLQTANLNAIKALGRSDLFLKLEIIKKIVGLTAMLSTIFISVKVMACSYLVTTILSAIINSYPNKELIGYSFKEQIVDILPSIGLSSLMFIGCYFITFLKLNDVLTIIIQVAIGVIIYIGGSILFRIESFQYLLDISKRFIKK